MADLLADWFVHTVTIARYTGSAGSGPVYADPETATGFVDDSNKLIRGATGEEVVSSARVYAPSSTALVPLGSKVTLTGPFLGRTSQVIAMSVHDAGSDMPNHVELALL